MFRKAVEVFGFGTVKANSISGTYGAMSRAGCGTSRTTLADDNCDLHVSQEWRKTGYQSCVRIGMCVQYHIESMHYSDPDQHHHQGRMWALCQHSGGGVGGPISAPPHESRIVTDTWQSRLQGKGWARQFGHPSNPDCQELESQ